jgi:hypothetical protein
VEPSFSPFSLHPYPIPINSPLAVPFPRCLAAAHSKETPDDPWRWRGRAVVLVPPARRLGVCLPDLRSTLGPRTSPTWICLIAATFADGYGVHLPQGWRGSYQKLRTAGSTFSIFIASRMLSSELLPKQGLGLLSHPKISISECEPFSSINLNFQKEFHLI